MTADPGVPANGPEPTKWPATLSPATGPVYSRVQTAIKADPASVWAVVIRAAAWPEWFRHVKQVQLDDGGEDLAPDTGFRWRISGQRFRSRVRVFAPESQIAWESRNPLIHTFHAWHLLPTATGCTVVDEECQRGPLPRASRPVVGRALHRVHQQWLESRAARLESDRKQS